MSNDVKPTNRIPPLPVGQMTNTDGTPTAEELLFRQALVNALQQNMGSDGLVAPAQTTTNIATIVANTATAQGATTTNYTCKPGTFFYDSTEADPTHAVKVVILVAGVPTLKRVVLA